MASVTTTTIPGQILQRKKWPCTMLLSVRHRIIATALKGHATPGAFLWPPQHLSDSLTSTSTSLPPCATRSGLRQENSRSLHLNNRTTRLTIGTPVISTTVFLLLHFRQPHQLHALPRGGSTPVFGRPQRTHILLPTLPILLPVRSAIRRTMTARLHPLLLCPFRTWAVANLSVEAAAIIAAGTTTAE